MVRHYGVNEIAQAIGVSRWLVAQWRRRGKLPKPDQMLSTGPIWHAGTIEPWIRNQRAGTE
jgi:hypothetical protein